MFKAINNRIARIRKNNIMNRITTQEKLNKLIEETSKEIGFDIVFDIQKEHSPSQALASYQLLSNKIVWSGTIEETTQQAKYFKLSIEDLVLIVLSHEWGHYITPDIETRARIAHIFGDEDEILRIEKDAWKYGKPTISRINPSILGKYNKVNRINLNTYRVNLIRGSL